MSIPHSGAKRLRKTEVKLMSNSDVVLGANSESKGLESNVQTSPGKRAALEGKSVEYIPTTKHPHWFPIRATHHRAQQIFNTIRKLDFDGRIYEPYLPLLRKIVYSNEDFQNPTQFIQDIPLDSGLLFVKMMLKDFRTLLDMDIPGLTPYYNHFYTNEFGKNDLLIVPEVQMKSFRIIVESGNEHILIDQAKAPKFLKGDDVVVIGGPFAGVEGKVLRFRSQKRVFVELPGLGIFGTAYVPNMWLRRVERE